MAPDLFEESKWSLAFVNGGNRRQTVGGGILVTTEVVDTCGAGRVSVPLTHTFHRGRQLRIEWASGMVVQRPERAGL